MTVYRMLLHLTLILAAQNAAGCLSKLCPRDSKHAAGYVICNRAFGFCTVQ